jgi:hypothetical protein
MERNWWCCVPFLGAKGIIMFGCVIQFIGCMLSLTAVSVFPYRCPLSVVLSVVCFPYRLYCFLIGCIFVFLIGVFLLSVVLSVVLFPYRLYFCIPYRLYFCFPYRLYFCFPYRLYCFLISCVIDCMFSLSVVLFPYRLYFCFPYRLCYRL